jgi:hypothetical protein
MIIDRGQHFMKKTCKSEALLASRGLFFPDAGLGSFANLSRWLFSGLSPCLNTSSARGGLA